MALVLPLRSAGDCLLLIALVLSVDYRASIA